MGGFDVSRIDLTAVIPIRWMDNSTSTLPGVIRAALDSGIGVLLVVNNQDSPYRKKMMDSFNAIKNEKFLVLESLIESPGSARNIGLSSCNTKYVTFWDADDLPIISNVHKLINTLQSNHEWKFGIGSFEIIDAASNSVCAINILEGDSELERRISKNPGIWRWIFEVKRIGDVRFRDFSMGEDQDFIADLNPQRSEILISETITYKYVKGWPNQLTRNKSAVQSITSSINYLAMKIEDQSANNWHKKFLLRQILTSIKRGSWSNRMETIQIVARLIRTNAR
jgi:hypothetical protein